MAVRLRPVPRRSVPLLAALIFLVACDAGAAPPTEVGAAPPDIGPYVTGEAAAALSGEGTFPYAGPTDDRGERMISPERAGELALGYVRAFGQFFHRSWERDAGRAIHLASLRADPRVFFAEAPYGRFPDGPFHPGYRKAYGPVYLVTLTDGRSPVLLIGVSAFNVDVGVDERGLAVTPPVGGNEFVSFGIPSDTNAYVPLTPERAVERVAVRTGARISRTPALAQMSVAHHPALALWRLELDRPVSVRTVTGGREKLVGELFVNGRGHYLIPADQQPQGDMQEFVIGPPWDPRDRRTMPATVPILPGRATEWLQVVPVNAP